MVSLKNALRLAFRLSIGCSSIAFGPSAFATSCDTSTIDGRSVDQTAKTIFETSDIVGYAFVRQVDGAPRIQQQELQFVALFKGNASVVRLEPRVIDRVRRVDPAIRWFDWKPDELHLIALVRTTEGAVSPVCLYANIKSKPLPDLHRALTQLRQAHQR